MVIHIYPELCIQWNTFSEGVDALTPSFNLLLISDGLFMIIFHRNGSFEELLCEVDLSMTEHTMTLYSSLFFHQIYFVIVKEYYGDINDS